MRQLIKEFVKICAETLPVFEPIYEFGSLQVPGQEGFADIRPIFPGKDYVGCDMHEGVGVDRVLDLHNIDLPSDSVGSVLVLDTLEHVEFLRRALEEVRRVLKPGGLLVMTSVMNFQIHDYPCDYWRFTPEGFRSLLRSFESCFVDFAGNKDYPHTVVGIGYNGDVAQHTFDVFATRLEQWKAYWHKPSGPRRRGLRKLLASVFRKKDHDKYRVPGTPSNT